jgi:hypothetical protein
MVSCMGLKLDRTFFLQGKFSLYSEGYKNLQCNDLVKTVTYEGRLLIARIKTNIQSMSI